MANLNWVDFAFLAIFLFSTLAGFARGFVKETVSLLTLFAAFFVATMFANTLADFITSTAVAQNVVTQSTASTGIDTTQPISYVALAISYASLFVGTIIVGSIIGFFVNLAFKTGILGIGNRILGAVFGLIRGYILNLVIIFVIQLSPLSAQPSWLQSNIVSAYQPAVIWLGNIVSPSLANLKQKLEKTMQDVGNQIQNLTNG